ncbi:MAG: hypothetical protein ACTSUE_05520 [Promethearchaeota archaeon]
MDEQNNRQKQKRSLKEIIDEQLEPEFKRQRDERELELHICEAFKATLWDACEDACHHINPKYVNEWTNSTMIFFLFGLSKYDLGIVTQSGHLCKNLRDHIENQFFSNQIHIRKYGFHAAQRSCSTNKIMDLEERDIKIPEYGDLTGGEQLFFMLEISTQSEP